MLMNSSKLLHGLLRRRTWDAENRAEFFLPQIFKSSLGVPIDYLHARELLTFWKANLFRSGYM